MLAIQFLPIDQMHKPDMLEMLFPWQQYIVYGLWGLALLWLICLFLPSHSVKRGVILVDMRSNIAKDGCYQIDIALPIRYRKLCANT